MSITNIAEGLVALGEKIQRLYKAGQKSEYDRWWDFIQYNGELTQYQHCFYGRSLDDFYPKYDIRPVNATEIFRDTYSEKGNILTQPFDLVERLNECGVVIDVSNCTAITYCFYNSPFTRIPTLDMRKAASTTKFLCLGGKTKKVDKIILTVEGQSLENFFGYAGEFEDVEIEGTIIENLKIKDCSKMTLASLASILTALKDYSGTSNEYKYTVTLHSDLWARLAEAGATSPNGTTWEEYVISKGWNIA